MYQRREGNTILIKRHAKREMAIPFLPKDVPKRRNNFILTKSCAKEKKTIEGFSFQNMLGSGICINKSQRQTFIDA